MNRRGQGRGDRGRVPGFVLPVPKQIPGLVAWYRADKGITIGTGVSAWADQSGTGDPNKNLTQATGTKQPTFNASDAAYGGRPTLSFAAASLQFLVSGTWISGVIQPYSAFVVGNGGAAGANQYFTDGLTLDTGDILASAAGPSVPAIYAGVALSGGVLSAASSMVLGGDFNGTSSALYQNAVTAVATGNAGTSGRSGLTLASAAVGAGGFLTGKMAEVVIYSNLITASQRGQLFNYFGSRYGITIGA